MLACASDQGTIHLFKINDENKKSNFASLSGLSSFFGSQWSSAQLRVNDQYCKIAILKGKVFAISRSGLYYMGSLADMGNIKVDK